jgi:hypothetical protein
VTVSFPPLLEVLEVTPFPNPMAFSRHIRDCIERRWKILIYRGDEEYEHVLVTGHTSNPALFENYNNILEKILDFKSSEASSVTRISTRAVVAPDGTTLPGNQDHGFLVRLRLLGVEGTIALKDFAAGILLETLYSLDTIPHNINWVYRQWFTPEGVYVGPEVLRVRALVLVSNPFPHDISGLKEVPSLVLGHHSQVIWPEVLKCDSLVIRTEEIESLPAITPLKKESRILIHSPAPLHSLPHPSLMKGVIVGFCGTSDTISYTWGYGPFYEEVTQVTSKSLGYLMDDMQHSIAVVRAFIRARLSGSLKHFVEKEED